MRAIAINGSPRKGGNTEAMLNMVLAPLTEAGWETEYVRVGGKAIRGCIACMKCWENKDGQCAIKVDDFNPLMEKMLASDAIVIGSPTYFASVTAETKAVLDRSGMVALANNRAFAGKVGAAVVAVRRGGAIHVFDTINHMYQMSQMIVPGSIYWNSGRGLHKEEVHNDAEGTSNMKNLGETIAWLCKAMQPHMGSYPKSADMFE